MARVLTGAGHKVLDAATGVAGLRLAREHQPDVMIVDLMLPDMDGIEVCLQIQGDAELAGIEMVLVSSIRTSSEEQAEGFAAGVCEYIARPMANREFLARVEARLKEKKTRNSLESARDSAAEKVDKQAMELHRSAEILGEAITSKALATKDRIALEEELQNIFTHAPLCLFLTDSDARLPRLLASLSLKALEKVEYDGISSAVTNPHILRKFPADWRERSKSLVVAKGDRTPLPQTPEPRPAGREGFAQDIGNF